VLGLSRDCTQLQIRDAYRVLARQLHPDLNRGDADATKRSQVLNAAYETLSDPARRGAYDRELDRASQASAPRRGARIDRNIKEELRLPIEDFLRGTTVNVAIKDPANAGGEEMYRVAIPPMTAPGSRLRVPRRGGEGFIELRLKPRSGFRLKSSGADLKTDLRISAHRAEQGGTETVERPTGGIVRVTIPKRVKRGEIIRIAGEGMPKLRGGRGDLLVRISYRPEVRVTRAR
jgi:DnaJ-class molecular chaperone